MKTLVNSDKGTDHANHLFTPHQLCCLDKYLSIKILVKHSYTQSHCWLQVLEKTVSYHICQLGLKRLMIFKNNLSVCFQHIYSKKNKLLTASCQCSMLSSVLEICCKIQGSFEINRGIGKESHNINCFYIFPVQIEKQHHFAMMRSHYAMVMYLLKQFYFINKSVLFRLCFSRLPMF